jgi:serine/threonine protein kinase/WD40 repeat protein
MNDIPSVADVSVEAQVGQIADEFVERLNRGEEPDIEEYARRHPEIDSVLRQVLSALRLVRMPGEDSAGADVGGIAGAVIKGCLGDFRILREVGRGGMGVVYEAEQLSLDRRVALKVLPFAAAMDPKQLQRFKNEAQAAAQLHHQNIVPVYGVGCERGVHYYAMQFIEGQTLAKAIAEGRQLRNHGPDTSLPASPLALDASPLTTTPPVALLSTERSTKQPDYFHTVARLGVQAAEALEHAHSFGIIHRDIKPANLLVDVRGNVWVTDFGLARFHSDAGLTMSGDMLGTLRYMSPEQALAKHGLVDHRTDVYSLGATLYEMLTLQPVCPGDDRQEVLRQIGGEDPQPPRSLNPAIPADLETIVLKALAKEPEGRYGTAQELGDDLSRFLEDRPIRAKRPTLWQRGRKWLRRHQGKVLTAGLSAFCVLAVSTIVVLQQRDAALLTLERFQQAEQDKTVELSRFRRLAGEAGQYFAGLEQIRAVIKSIGRKKLTDAQVLALRNEAIACLAAPDARPLLVRDSAEEHDRGGDAIDPGLEHYTHIDRHWNLILRRLANDQVVKTFPPPAQRPGVRFWYAKALFSPDGRFLAIVYLSNSRSALPVLGATVVLLGSPLGQGSLLTACALCSGRTSQSQVHSCLVWDLRTDRKVLEKEVCVGIGFHPESHTLALHTSDGNITFYHLPEGEETRRLETHEQMPMGMSFDPDGQRLAYLDMRKKTLQILDLQTSKVKFACPIHAGQPEQHRNPDQLPHAWSPDGRWLAIGAEDGRVYVYDTVRRRLHSVLEGHEAGVIAVAFSPQGSLLASAAGDRSTRLWDPLSGKQWVSLAGNFRRFSVDGQRLAFERDRTFGIWELAWGQVCRTLHDGAVDNQIRPSGTWGVDFSSDGRLLASASNDGVRWWDAVKVREINHLAIRRTGSVKFDPRGCGLVTHGEVGLLYWPLQPDPDDPAKSWRAGPSQLLYRAAGKASVPRVAWDRHGHWLAFNDVPTNASEFEAVLLNREQPGQMVELSDPVPRSRELVRATVLSPDGHWVAATYWHFAGARVWDTRDPKRARSLPGIRSDDGGRLLGFSPDNQWLIVGGFRGYRWWRVGTWEPGHTLAMQQLAEMDQGIAFSSDGALLAITRTPYTVQLLDPANPNHEFATLTAPDRHVITWLAFNPDATQLAVAARGQVIQLWDLRLLRQELVKLDLDWDQKPYPPLEGDRSPQSLRVTMLPGGVPTGAVIAENYLEAEDLTVVAADCKWHVQHMDPWGVAHWSNGRQLFGYTNQGGYVELELDCSRAGRYLLDISFTRAPDYGIVAVSLDGEKIGETFDGYRQDVSPSGLISFGAVELGEGRHRLRFMAVDKNPTSTGYLMGIDYLTLRLVR